MKETFWAKVSRIFWAVVDDLNDYMVTGVYGPEIAATVREEREAEREKEKRP